jgi:hypothetical protein
VALNFIIVAPILKFTISSMCHYKVMKQKVSERPIIKVHIRWLELMIRGDYFE